MQTAADLMTRAIITCPVNASLYDGHMIMKQNDIRHLPIINRDGQVVGLLGQKEILRETLHIAADRSTHRLNHYEKQKCVADVMATDIKTITPETLLAEAAQYFLDNKQACLPIVEAEQLVGMLTPIDFVKLSLTLLSDEQKTIDP